MKLSGRSRLISIYVLMSSERNVRHREEPCTMWGTPFLSQPEPRSPRSGVRARGGRRVTTQQRGRRRPTPAPCLRGGACPALRGALGLHGQWRSDVGTGEWSFRAPLPAGSAGACPGREATLGCAAGAPPPRVSPPMSRHRSQMCAAFSFGARSSELASDSELFRRLRPGSGEEPPCVCEEQGARASAAPAGLWGGGCVRTRGFLVFVLRLSAQSWAAASSVGRIWGGSLSFPPPPAPPAVHHLTPQAQAHAACESAAALGQQDPPAERSIPARVLLKSPPVASLPHWDMHGNAHM